MTVLKQYVGGSWTPISVGTPGAAGANGASTGMVTLYAGTTTNVPTGWLICDGAAVSRTTYADLFNIIGTQYGVGNGTTTFNLPKMLNDYLPSGSTANPGHISDSFTPAALSHAHNAGAVTIGDYNLAHGHNLSLTVAQHGHDYGNLAVAAEATHTHGAGNINASAETSHTHNSGNYANATEPAHAHTYNGGANAPGSATSNNGSHSHGISGNSGTGTSHDHNISGNTGAGSSHGHAMSGSSGNSSITFNVAAADSTGVWNHNHTANAAATAAGSGSLSGQRFLYIIKI